MSVRIISLTITFCLINQITSSAQSLKTTINRIEGYCKSIDADTTIKRVRVPSSKISDSGILGPTHVFYHVRNDTIYKVETFIDHMHPQNVEYYYINDDFVYCKYTDYGQLNSYPRKQTITLKVAGIIQYFFYKKKLIHVKSSGKNNGKFLKNNGKYCRETAEQYLKFVK